MQNIFISYRRGDSAGHAGRLFDRLKDRLGAEHVFMDVTDLRPGQDFVTGLEQAVAQADGLLAIIGPGWLAATDASGRRRLDDPEDFVRREIAAALANGAVVMPVLVEGATMPRAEQLPEPLRPLARRQAFALSDARWDSDLQALMQFLTPGSAAPPAQPMTPRMRRLAALALLAMVLVAGAGWLAFHAMQGSAPRTDATPGTAAPGMQADAPPASEPTGDQQRFAVALPAVHEVRFRTSRAQLVFTLLAIRLEPRDSATQVLTVLVRMLNQGPYDEAFGSDQFRLVVAGNEGAAPTNTVIGAVEATAAKEAGLRFVAPANADTVALDVRLNGESTRIPIPLRPRNPIRPGDPALDEFGRAQPSRVVDALKALPASLPAGQRIDVGGASYEIKAAVIERETVEKASITLTIRCTAPAGVSTYFGAGSVRLWVDGVPRAPVNFVNLAIDPGASKEDRFVFDLASIPQTLAVGLLNGGENVKVPLTLGPLAQR